MYKGFFLASFLFNNCYALTYFNNYCENLVNGFLSDVKTNPVKYSNIKQQDIENASRALKTACTRAERVAYSANNVSVLDRLSGKGDTPAVRTTTLQNLSQVEYASGVAIVDNYIKNLLTRSNQDKLTNLQNTAQLNYASTAVNAQNLQNTAVMDRLQQNVAGVAALGATNGINTMQLAASPIIANTASASNVASTWNTIEVQKMTQYGYTPAQINQYIAQGYTPQMVLAYLNQAQGQSQVRYP